LGKDEGWVSFAQDLVIKLLKEVEGVPEWRHEACAVGQQDIGCDFRAFELDTCNVCGAHTSRYQELLWSNSVIKAHLAFLFRHTPAW